MQDCSNLAIPATGSRTLYALLAQHSPHAHHNENRHHVSPGVHCLLVTVSDPALRLEVVWRFQQRHRSALLHRGEPILHLLNPFLCIRMDIPF